MLSALADYPPTLVTACCDLEQGKAKEDIFEHPHVPDLIIGPPPRTRRHIVYCRRPLVCPGVCGTEIVPGRLGQRQGPLVASRYAA
jgi:hypothetical protein